MSYDRNKYLLRIEHILRAFEHQELADCLSIIRQEIEIAEASHYREASFRRGYEYSATAVYEALCAGTTPSSINKWLVKLHHWRKGDLSKRTEPPGISEPPRDFSRQTRSTANRKQAKNVKTRKPR
jgi:hypothetical protein